MPASESQQNQNPDPLGADAAELFAEDELTRRFIPVFTRIAEGAVEREQNRELPYAPVEWLREAGYT
ncbi:hypothetical protein QMO17_32795, partial [Klebsiella pneumoniae]|nr:hypothetical protein [Klebsiella pneumoniae]